MRRTKYVLLFLSAIVLFAGCSLDPGNDDVIAGLDPRLIGVWLLSGEGWSEEYEITNTHLTFTGDFGAWGGSIEYAARFTNDTGIIIIRYGDGTRQDWSIFGDYDTDGRDYYGIYFRNLTDTSVIFSNTSDISNDFAPSETATLEEAIERFGFDNMTDWMSMDAGTTPSIKQEE